MTPVEISSDTVQIIKVLIILIAVSVMVAFAIPSYAACINAVFGGILGYNWRKI